MINCSHVVPELEKPATRRPESPSFLIGGYSAHPPSRPQLCLYISLGKHVDFFFLLLSAVLCDVGVFPRMRHRTLLQLSGTQQAQRRESMIQDCSKVMSGCFTRIGRSCNLDSLNTAVIKAGLPTTVCAMQPCHLTASFESLTV